MPLTPADVHNVAFKKPPIGKRGYDEEEVDAFLDEVERELARLIEENNELRAQGGGRAAAAGAGGDPRLAAELGDLKATANWRAIAAEIWPFTRAAPSTPMGEAEAEWLASRDPVPARRPAAVGD